MNYIKIFLRKINGAFSWVFKSRLRIIILVIIIVTIGYFGYKNYSTKTAVPTYQTAQAETGTLVTNITASGTISSGNSIEITTQATGVVNNVYVKNGDSVVQGQKLADLQLDQDAQARSAAAWSSYQSAVTSLKSAQNSLRSDQASLEKVLDDIHLFQYGNGGFGNVGTANETETQKAQRTTAQVAVDKDNDNIAQIQNQINASWLAYLESSPTITAPMDGTITNLTLTPGLSISSSNNSSSSTSIQKLGAISRANGTTQATVSVSEIDAPKVQVGQKATLTLDAFSDKTFTGKVVAIDTNGAVSSGVTTYTTTIAFDSAPDNIYPNMAVTAKIITHVKDNVLLVPSAAVQTLNGTSTVRVMNNNQIETRTVSIGDSNDTQTEITSGLNEGDTVVIGGGSATTRTPAGGTSVFGGGFGRGFGGGGGGNVRVIRGG